MCVVFIVFALGVFISYLEQALFKIDCSSRLIRPCTNDPLRSNIDKSIMGHTIPEKNISEQKVTHVQMMENSVRQLKMLRTEY